MATTDSYGQNVGVAALTDAPSAFALAFAIVDSIAPRGVMRFASATARSATLTGTSAPVEGMVSWLQDTNVLSAYDGTAWRQIPLAVTPTVYSSQISMPTFSTAGSFVDFTSGTWPPLTATIPPSGKVKITLSGAVRNQNTASSTGWMAWRSTGGIVESSSEANGLSCAGSRTYAARPVIRTGAPGSVFTLTPQWQFSSINGSTAVTGAEGGQLIVEPVYA